ncbi:aminoglycoside phosphotransferase family protein [Nocardia fluminea]|uniref:aminoglycoside phosphotransferase family protein n=1 Tax=Nocardia fluminea TaxID=134984 RepID=UPI0033D27418
MTRSQADLDDLTPDTFTPERTRPILEVASRLAGFDATGAELLRHHTNAVYLLASEPVVIKIGRPGEQEPIDVVGLVRWLEARQVPTVPLADAEQPIDIAGCGITYWRYLPQNDVIVSAGDIADPLGRLHARETWPPLLLPEDHLASAFDAITRSIQASTILSPDDRQSLEVRRDELVEQLDAITFDLPPSLIHGDAHHRNTLWDNKGLRSVLCDWESAAIGQPEWDLVTVEVHCRRFEHPAIEYPEFVRRYGLDIREWSGYPWLRDVRELRMITTNARKSAPGSANADEVLRRIGALREGVAIGWNIM